MQITFDTLRYDFYSDSIEVYAEFEGTSEEVLLAKFERKPVGFLMVAPKDKKYSNYLISGVFGKDYSTDEITKRLDKHFNRFVSDVKKDAMEALEEKLKANEAVSSVTSSKKRAFHKKALRKKKAGTGYWIEFEIDVNSVIGEPKVLKITKKPETDISELGYWGHEKVIPFEMEVEIPISVDVNRASSYMYGIEEPYEDVKAVITKVKGLAPADKEAEDYWDIDNPEEVKEVLKDLRNIITIKPTYNSGWVHAAFDGELDDVELDDDIDGITSINLKLDQDVADMIEYYCSGDYLEDEEPFEEE